MNPASLCHFTRHHSVVVFGGTYGIRSEVAETCCEMMLELGSLCDHYLTVSLGAGLHLTRHVQKHNNS